MLFQLLAEEAEAANNSGYPKWVSYVLIGVLVVVLVVSMILMNRRSKKRDAEAKARIDAVKPGSKVTTVGGVSGIVVEVNPEEDTFVLETGTETTGKSYMKFVRQAIMDTDAVPETTDSKKDGKEVVEDGEKTETAEEKTEEAKQPAEEVKTEEKSDKE